MSKAILAKTVNLFSRFVRNEAFSGILLILTSVVAILWANSPGSQYYFDMWQTKFSITFGDFGFSKPLLLWINDGLMAMFFFVVGLEIKREIWVGELSTMKKAALPIIAAVGGMIVPALFYVVFNYGQPTMNGWGIPMATDIAFSLGVLALLGKRVPLSLKIFLTALAIVDDLGAVLVIAIFYTSDFSLISLAFGLLLLAVMWGMNILGVRNALAYAIIGIVGVWSAFLLSGIHATIAGVLAAFAIPAKTKINTLEFTEYLQRFINKLKNAPQGKHILLTNQQQHIVSSVKVTCSRYESPLQALEHALHPWVAYLVIPIFALSNTGVLLSGDLGAVVSQPISMGIIVGLLIGKPVGIWSFSWLACKLGFASLPKNINWTHLVGTAFLAGIGFTMSLFITGLAFSNPEWVDVAKVGVLLSSIIAGLVGFLILYFSLKEIKNPE